MFLANVSNPPSENIYKAIIGSTKKALKKDFFVFYAVILKTILAVMIRT